MSRSMPGCLTPTEILDAWEAGADIVKVFPATALGPGYIKDVRGPLPQVKLMPTGGVTLDNAGDWIRAGAVAVGVGTALTRREGDRGRRFRRARAPTPSGSSPTSARRRQSRHEQSRHVRRDHAAPEPAGVRALPAVAGARRDVRRRRSQRRRQPGAVRARERLRHAPADARDRRRGDPRAARRRRATPTHIVRGGDRIGVYYAEAGASQRASTVIYDRARFGDQRDGRRTRSTGTP